MGSVGPLAEEGRKALQRRAGGTQFWREEGRSISFGNLTVKKPGDGCFTSSCGNVHRQA
jgi:hypothetical protein